ncbi:hypothetical protein FA13DRAFT_1801512 [Coprinellus micaceus]|uniref:Uncharacterized protein n=1 Tax=Coprinellus micaceus TaxID=71717 RepID=A0A4Y7SFV9_COPMI|nr:hypothetical protein FA13DRAFT_1801512 [Coprinellus micaceus]
MPPQAALPVRRHTIGSFLRLLAHLLADGETAKFVIALLTGQYNGEQASIEALENRIYDAEDPDDPDDITLYPYKTSFDVDSALGVSDDICIVGEPIGFYVVPKFSHSLRKSVGLTRRVEIGGVGTHVGLHEVPNFLFAHWGIRNEIIIFFPGRYKAGERDGYKMDIADIATFFECVTRPALQEAVPDLRASNLPPTYEAELWRLRSENGQVAGSARMLSEEVVAKLAGNLRDVLEDAIAAGSPLHWARGFFFVHQVRGVKDANVYPPTGAAGAINRFIANNHISAEAVTSDPKNWYFDAGVEISSASTDDSLAWRADSHTAILRDVFWIPEGHAVRMTKTGSTSYYKDPVSHLTEVAGCRITPGIRGRGPLGIVKLQAYQTDKAVTAAVVGQGSYHAKRVKLKQVMEDRDGGPIDLLFAVYEESRKKKVVSNARLEVRVPYAVREEVHRAMQGVNWRKYLVAIPYDNWWNLRTYSIIAYKAIAGTYADAKLADRTNINALGLLMMVVWLTNSLHATPDTGPSSRELLNIVLPRRPRTEMTEMTLPFRLARAHQGRSDGVENEFAENRDPAEPGENRPAREEEEESSDEETDADEDEIPYGPGHFFGMIFMSGLVWDDGCSVPKIPGRTTHALKGGPFRHFAEMQYDEFCDLAYDSMLFRPRTQKRTRNKTQQRPVVLDEGESIPTIFDIKNGSREIARPAWQGGRINRQERTDQEKVTRNEFLSEIYRQLCVDAISLSPCPKGKPHGYVKIDNAHFSKVTIDVFKDRNPGKVLRAARMCRGDDNDWELAFKHLLPSKGELKAGDAQNYPKCAYYKMWGHYMAQIDSRPVIETARTAFKNQFLADIAWFPWAKPGRLWESNSKVLPSSKSSFASPGLGDKVPAPWILTRQHCIWKSDEKWTPGGTVTAAPGEDGED